MFLLGGEQRSDRPLLGGATFYDYRQARILKVEPNEDRAEVVYDHVSPADVRPDENPTILFKSGTVENGMLYACTQTEVLIFSLPDLERTGYVSHPWFNDLHHVRPTPDGSLLVANSGLDMVLEVDLDGTVVREWSVLDTDPWERFSKSTDYRKVRSTKPHLAHPNHIFFIGDDIWVTRFEQGDAVCLTASRAPVKIADERVHDGLVHDGSIYFTSVDGKIVVVDQESLKLEEVIDLNPLHGGGELMGWCRGLAFDDDDRLWVGFSRLRPTQFRENVAWVKNKFRHMKETHLASFDLTKNQFLSEFEVERHGLHAVFSIFPSGRVDAAPGRETVTWAGAQPP